MDGIIFFVIPAEPSFTETVIRLIASIPCGRVATYGQIAACAGNHRASRQVARILHSCSDKRKLPWHRVVGGRGSISLLAGGGFEEQKALLEGEGIEVAERGLIDLREYLWNPASEPDRS